jgi:formylmethanofuran dehydrogenase subunit C
MKNKNKGNLLVTFILLIGLSAVVLSLAAFIAIRLQETGFKVTDKTAYYYADAGLNKAVWYLSAPSGSGGKGMSWRVTASREVFGRGDYRFSIINTAVSTEVLIISTGEVGSSTSTVVQVMDLAGYPTSFNYAMYTDTTTIMNGNVAIYGDIYVDGNTTLNGNASVYGNLYHPAGTTITPGSGTYTDGGAQSPAPTKPTLDTTYYDAYIATAQSQPSGSLDYNNAGTVNLNGQTLYVNGDVHVNATTTFVGPGRIVASGNIIFNGNTTSNNAVEFIAKTGLTVNGNTSATSANFYSAGTFISNGNTRLDVGSIISKGNTTFNGNMSMTGLLFTLGTFTLQGNPTITGVVCSAALNGVDTINGSARITFDQSKLPSTLPAGFTATSLSRKHGTWREY